MTTKLHEKESGSVSPVGKTWLAQLISEGQGSSGLYGGEMLARDGATAFPSGSHIYKDHLGESEGFERGGSHSIDALVGVTMADASWDEETRSLRAPIKWFNGFESFIAEAKDYIGLSIEAAGTRNDEGVVESLHPSPFNAIAVVPRAGRDGKVLSLLESYRDNISHNADNSAATNDGKDGVMTPEEIQEAVKAGVAAAFAEATPNLVTALKESLVPAPAEEEDAEVATPAEVAEAVVAAALLPASRARVFEALKNDPTLEVAKVIESEKAFADSLLKEQEDNAAPGVLRESRKSNEPTSFAVTGWSAR